MKKENGITLIEILVVISISSFIVVNLLGSFLKSRTNVNEVARILIADIRAAQANALASKQFTDPMTGISTHRCGYGIFLDLNSQNNYTNQQYLMYVGRLPQSSGCDANNWKFNNSQDTPILLTRVLDSRLEFWDPNGSQRPNTNDITFEPNNGHIRIDNQHNTTNQNQNLSQIVIRKRGVTTCTPEDCVYICVYSFGRIAMRSDQACPLCSSPIDNNPISCQQW